MTPEVVILGGGPAGLAVAWALELDGVPYRVLEAAPVPGGNARTLQFGPFRYDTGPHRFHDRDPGATQRVVELLGDDLQEVEAPSRIFWSGRFLDFPLRPLQTLTRGGAGYALRAGADLLAARIRRTGREEAADFGSWATARFGRTVAGSFLIPFSEKLWGLPASELSPEIAGRRLPGFRLVDLVKDLVLRPRRAKHMEGRFLYPRHGYGQIVDAMAARLSPGRVQCGARVTRLQSLDDRITAVEYEEAGRRQRIATPAVVNTLPITVVVRMMDPPPPEPVLAAARQLRFRHVALAVLCLDQPSISDAACLYFPDPTLPFSRAHEPRNRSPVMSPPGKTSLVVEFPCFEEDPVWTRDDTTLTGEVVQTLDRMGLIRRAKVGGATVTRLRNAYPVYSRHYPALAGAVLGHLGRFENLQTLGRGGGFFYGHVHDFISLGFQAATAASKALTAGA